ncbi:DUF6355 family natural product biosynthesis protein [Streptomyces niger]|uniref:DUF6355 family natural product biosynthesis protein n=1 Tax=Streptomyces niger TaxID=66373 RepID=UPI00069AF9C0|nr:DUF6355 family natural product biosynthesis protein [Streptomyces niger]
MSVRRFLTGAVGAAALVLGMTVSTAPGAAADPCGFYETGSDAYYNHCTDDGSHVVIEVEVWGPNYERCVVPGVTWLGSADEIDGAHYVGRTC